MGSSGDLVNEIQRKSSRNRKSNQGFALFVVNSAQLQQPFLSIWDRCVHRLCMCLVPSSVCKVTRLQKILRLRGTVSQARNADWVFAAVLSSQGDRSEHCRDCYKLTVLIIVVNGNVFSMGNFTKKQPLTSTLTRQPISLPWLPSGGDIHKGQNRPRAGRNSDLFCCLCLEPYAKAPSLCVTHHTCPWH